MRMRARRCPSSPSQLPWLPEKDVSGASLGVHVLDAMRYILDSAGLTAKPAKKRNVVVNLSDGGMAGSHNAGSIIEAALDELLTRPGLSLVIAAGNAYRARPIAKGISGRGGMPSCNGSCWTTIEPRASWRSGSRGPQPRR